MPHATGPLKVVDNSKERKEYPFDICTIGLAEDIVGYANTKDNAALFAGSPGLLEAAENILEQLRINNITSVKTVKLKAAINDCKK